MTDREKEILQLIKLNPMISQNELAEKLDITRSSVSVHISNLMKKGFIVGKGYVIHEDENEVIVVGGANIDIIGIGAKNKHDSNPGEINLSIGGVGRNIAENLCHLGVRVSLITALGDDFYGQEIYKACVQTGIDVSMSKKCTNEKTSVYMEILDANGNLDVAISDMKIMTQLQVEDIMIYHHQLQKSKAIVVDGNVEADIIAYLAKHHGDKLFFESVSMTKAMKVLPYLKGIRCITPNINEAKTMVGKDADSEELLTKLHDLGVVSPVITNGAEGVIFWDKKPEKANAIPVDVVSVTGAGDAFMAGLVFGYYKNKPLKTAVQYGLILASETLAYKGAVNKNIQKLDLDQEERQI